MTLSVPVAADVELLVTGYLRTHPDVSPLATGGLHTELGPHPSWPLLLVKRLGGPRLYPGHISRPRVQVEAWGEQHERPEARLLAATAQAALLDLPGIHGSTVVTDVTEESDLMWLPDPVTTPARPRYLFSLLITTHPL